MQGTPKKQLSLVRQVIPPSELQRQMAPFPYPYGLDVTSVLRALKRERIRLFLLDQTCSARCSNPICQIWFDTIYSSIGSDDLLITHITHNKESSFPLQYHISEGSGSAGNQNTQGGKKNERIWQLRKRQKKGD